MAVKALFYVQGIEKTVVSQGNTNMKVTLLPVTRATDDNIEWAKYTPGGKIELWVTQAGAQDFYEENLGKDVPITFG